MKLLNWFRRRTLEHDLDRELRDHVERRIADLMRAGTPEPEARRLANLDIGGLTQVREEVRDVWFTRWLRDFAYDLRYALRGLRRTPAFSAIGILSLALGIGATTAIYSLLDQVLLHALPVREPARIVLIDWKGTNLAGGFGTYNLTSYPLCRDLQQQTVFFESVLCRAALTVNLSTGGEHKPAAAELVSGTYFSTLGVTPARGRFFTPADDEMPGASPIVVLAHDFWRTELGGAADVIGRKVLVNQHPMTVVGVASESFRGVDVGQVPALWIPASMAADAIPGFRDLLDRRTRWMQILARLRPGMTPERAQAGLQPWFKSMLESDSRLAGFPVVTAEVRRDFFASTLTVTPAPQGHSPLRRSLSEPLWVLFAATALLLALACLNVAGLLLARGLAREREINTRLALGASRGRVGRQFLADGVVLALTGGLLGVALAPFAIRALIAFLPIDVGANALAASLDWRLLLFAFTTSAGVGILSGIAPAMHAGRKTLMAGLRERGGAARGAGLRKLIVTGQIAFSLVLVMGAVLFVRTLTGLLAKGPGFDTTSLVSFSLNPRRNGYSAPDANRLLRRVHNEVLASPAVRAGGLARFGYLLGGSWGNPMTVQTDRRIVTGRAVDLNAVTPGFFAAMGIRLLAGRDFEERDARAPDESGDYRCAIVNESFVKRYLDGRDPLGVNIQQGSGPDVKPNIRIVGVVADFSYRGMREQSEQAYFPFLESGSGSGTFYVRVRAGDQALATFQGIVNKIDPALPLISFRTLEEQVSRSLNTERLLAALSTTFGALALLLSLVGLYGVTSFVVTQRTREIGIRVALGATRGSAIWLVLRDAILMIAGGTLIAVPAVAALGRLFQSQLFGVRATDPITIVESTLLMTAAALIAAFIPAYRACTIAPSEALRLE